MVKVGLAQASGTTQGEISDRIHNTRNVSKQDILQSYDSHLDEVKTQHSLDRPLKSRRDKHSLCTYSAQAALGALTTTGNITIRKDKKV